VPATHRQWGTRLFQALLALYPGEFRDEYGREVAMVFADRYRRAASARQRAHVWLDGLLGVLREAPKEHLRMIAHDLRFAARTARRSPGFSATVVLTLALGIGANTAVFQLINAVRLQSLPIRDAAELVEVRIVGGRQGVGIGNGRYAQITRPVWQELRAHQQALSGLFAWGTPDLRVGEMADLRSVNGISVSGEFFSVLGIQPWRGRLIERSDEAACPGSRAVISHAYWQRALGGRELGRDVRLRINGESYEVIGVTPPGFVGLAVGESFDVAVPLCQPTQPRREVFEVSVMGRLGRGWTLQRASEHLATLSASTFEASMPTGYDGQWMDRFRAFRLAAYPASTGVSQLRADYDTSLNLLLAITGLVLLIACANLANLMLARAIARGREVSVRLTLGASRTRLLRQFLAESVVLAIIGAATGVALAQWLSRGLVRVLAPGGSSTLSLSTDWRVLLFAGGVAIAACVVFGLAPAFRAVHARPVEALRAGGRTMTVGHGRFSTQRLMVVTQIAVSLVLLVTALLFVRSFRNLTMFDPGMRRAGIVIGRVGFGQSGIPPERFSDFQRELVASVKAIPGVGHAATATQVPLLGSSWGHDVTVGGRQGGAKFTWVGPEYFATMGIPILKGRAFTLRDTAASPRVAIVNQAFVRLLVEGGDPIGRTLRTSAEPRYPATVYEIVGVIGDTRYNGLRGETPPMAFAPDSQYPDLGPWANIMIDSRFAPAETIAAVRHRLGQAHPEIYMEFDDFGQRILDGLTRERLLAVLAGFFGALATLLATIGLYGLVSFTMAQRRQEIGIRTAMGARRQQIVGLVMRDVGWLMGAGVMGGTVLSLLVGRSAATLLFGLTSYDASTFVVAGVVLAIVAATASVLPASRASRLDALTAMRDG
jgi:predicted permease